jgi:hypothetical protein
VRENLVGRTFGHGRFRDTSEICHVTELCLDHFLEAARADGKTDSEGEFTISHAQAVQKMARYSLPYPEAWILKVVQAAVIWQVSEIEVRQTKLYTTIEFCPQEKKNIPAERDVVATLTGQAGASTLPVGKLCLALRTLVRIEDYSFILTLNTGRTEVRPLYAGHEAQTLTRMDRVRIAKKNSPGLKLTVIHLRRGEHLLGRLLYRFSPWFGRSREIATELQRNATVCPLPIYLDGRLQNRLLRSPVYGFSRTERPLVLSGVRVSGEPLLAVGVDSAREHLSFMQGPQKEQSSDGGDRAFSGWFLLRGPEPGSRKRGARENNTYGLRHPRVVDHEVHWVCDGAVVQRDVFPFSTHLLRLTVFLNADDLRTDITGFLLTDSDEKKARWLAHLSCLTEEFEELARHTDRFFEESDQDWKTSRLTSAQKREWASMMERDLSGLSTLEEPELTRLEPTFGRGRGRSSAHSHKVLHSGKYTSELVQSKDGRSQLIISVDPASADSPGPIRVLDPDSTHSSPLSSSGPGPGR